MEYSAHRLNTFSIGDIHLVVISFEVKLCLKDWMSPNDNCSWPNSIQSEFKRMDFEQLIELGIFHFISIDHQWMRFNWPFEMNFAEKWTYSSKRKQEFWKKEKIRRKKEKFLWKEENSLRKKEISLQKNEKNIFFSSKLFGMPRVNCE